MKRLVLLVIILLILSIFIVSCVPAEDTTAADKEDTDVPEDKDKVELPDSAMETDEPEEDEPAPVEDYDEDYDDDLAGLPADLAVLMAKGKEKARNIHYLYRGPPLEFRDVYEYFIFGDKIKIIKSEPQQFVRGDYYNVVYIDTKTGDAVGYCEDDKRCDDMNTPFDTEYNEYLGTLPGEWFEIIDSAYKVGSEDIFDREANIYEFDYDGVKSRIWIDPFYGIPLQVRVDEYGDDPIIYHYEVRKVGNIKMADIEHQTMS
ncbi:MAG: hypothetical protein KAT43_06050 [Nanoarchaeota archaeon]|nr:hypothetical protein [Nanoarchaeota archaeon]